MGYLLANADRMEESAAEMQRDINAFREIQENLKACADSLANNPYIDSLEFASAVDGYVHLLDVYTKRLEACDKALYDSAAMYETWEAKAIAALLGMSAIEVLYGPEDTTTEKQKFSDTLIIGNDSVYVKLKTGGVINDLLAPVIYRKVYESKGLEWNPDEWESRSVGDVLSGLFDGDAGWNSEGGVGTHGGYGEGGGSLISTSWEIGIGTYEDNFHVGAGVDIGNARGAAGAVLSQEDKSYAGGSASASVLGLNLGFGKTINNVRGDVGVSASALSIGGQAEASYDAEHKEGTIDVGFDCLFGLGFHGKAHDQDKDDKDRVVVRHR